jgi:hypothetical protein
MWIRSFDTGRAFGRSAPTTESVERLGKANRNAYWTTGVLGSGNSGGYLSSTDQEILTGYGNADMPTITTAMGNVDPSFGLLDPGSEWNSASAEIYAYGSFAGYGGSNPDFGSAESDVLGG